MAPYLSPLRIRAASRGDIPAIVYCADSSVEKSEWIRFYGPRFRPRIFGQFDKVDDLSETWLDPNRVGELEVFVAEMEGTVVGFVTVSDRGRDLELVDLEVPRERHGRGIGSRLVQFVEEKALQEGKIAVTLGTSRNAAGVPWRSYQWWQRRGYQDTGDEENAWTRSLGPGFREIRMRKNLLRRRIE
jgi:predicted N-acetyltransferase YhbS